MRCGILRALRRGRWTLPLGRLRIRLGRLAPAGHYIAIRISFVFPVVEQNCLPEAWVREYTASGLCKCHGSSYGLGSPARGPCKDERSRGRGRPAVLSLQRTTAYLWRCRLLQRILTKVESVASVSSSGQIGSMRRSSSSARRAGTRRAYARPRNLTEAELKTLGLVKNGLLMKEIASALGVSESAVKQRLRDARLKLNAKTGPRPRRGRPCWAWI